MKQFIFKTIQDDTGFPVLKETATSYNVDNRRCYNDPQKIFQLACQLDCDKLTEEEAYCLCLDAKLHVLGLFLIGKGSKDNCNVDVRELFQKALLLGATRIVLWHNHPSGDPAPSPQDIELTKRVLEAGAIIGVELLDHIVVSRFCYRSIKEGCNVF